MVGALGVVFGDIGTSPIYTVQTIFNPGDPHPVPMTRDMWAEEFSRIHHLPDAQLAAVVEGLRSRGLVDATGGFTEAGREIKQRIEALTDELAAPAYDGLSADELDELMAGLEPIAATVSTFDS